jgi:hypothetical protein
MHAYEPRTDQPCAMFVADHRSGLALEDRDLRKEATDHEGCIGAALEALHGLYPPVVIGPVTLPIIGN